ncbi:MAG: hypothetical protein ACRDX9_14830 [Acidimicrobiia bacterium]
MDDVLALFETTSFRTGLRLGIIALAIGWALRFATGRYRPPMPIGGVLVAVATILAFYRTEEPLGNALAALGLILVGVLIARITKAPKWVAPLAAIPGAIWLAFGSPISEFTWVRVFIAVLIPVAGYLISDFETRYDRMGLGVVFFTLAALGAFAAVPDTEQALVLIATALPITLLAWPKVAVSLGMEGSFLAVAVLLWVTAAGGGGRPPSIVGSAACLGFLLLEPILVRLRPALVDLRFRIRQNWLGAVLASIPQFVLVIICSRIAARFSVMLPALLVVAAGYALAIVFGLYVGSRQPKRIDTPVFPEAPT